MLLVIQLPFTLLAITLGGVTWQQIFASYFALAAWMCLVANVALFCSVRCSTSGRAASMATATLLLFFGAQPILNGILSLKGLTWIPSEVMDVCELLLAGQQELSVIVRLNEILQPSGGNSALFGMQFWQNTGIGLLMFVLSVLLFNGYSEPTVEKRGGQTATVRRLVVGRCWRYPIVWKDFQFFLGGRSLWLIKFGGYCCVLGAFLWFYTLAQTDGPFWASLDQLSSTAFGTVTVLLSIEMLLYASNSLFMELRSFTIPSLRMLPIPTPLLLLQKLGACLIGLAPGIIALLLIFTFHPGVVLDDQHFPEKVVLWLFVALLSTHLTVLLSLYTRWAALPLALLLTSVSTPCIAAAAVGLTEITQQTAELNGIQFGIWLGIIVNFVWMWIFVLLPIQIEIINRWNRLSRQ